jgi:hypothetical protein
MPLSSIHTFLVLSGFWKCKCLAEHGIVTQCVVPPANIKDQYLTNVLLKINAKVCVMICIAILNVPYNLDLLADNLNSSLFLFVLPISLAG